MIENHVTSLEISKRLKELGVKAESCFYWFHDGNYYVEWRNLVRPSQFEDAYPAYLASELGEMLPYEVNIQNGENGKLEFRNIWGYVNCKCDVSYIGENDFFSVYAETEPDARAKMLIHLIEQGIIKL